MARGGARAMDAAFPKGRLSSMAMAIIAASLLAWSGSALAAGGVAGGPYFADALQSEGSPSTAFSIDVLDSGAPVIAGWFEGTAYFPTSEDDSIALTTTVGAGDAFVAAFNPDDSYFAWAVAAGGPLDDAAAAVTVTSDDTIIVSGRFGDVAHFPTSPDDSITLTGPNNLFVAAISADDSYFSWATNAGGAGVGYAEGLALAVTSEDTPVVTGQISDTAYFPTGPDDSISLTGPTDVFVAAMNRDDSYFSWAVGAGGAGSDVGFGVAVNQYGSPIITGRVDGTAYFPTAPDDSITLVGDPGSLDVFVAALNADDSYFAWAVTAGGPVNDEGYGIAIAPSGSPVITGHFGETAYFPTSADDSIALAGDPGSLDIFVAALNADDSYFAWAVQAGGPSDDGGTAVVVDGDGHVVVTGYFSNTAYFPLGEDDSVSLTASGPYDVFVAALNSDDSYFAWAVRAGGSSNDLGYGVSLVLDDTPVVTGKLDGTAYFPTGDDDSIALSGTDNSFVAWLSPSSPPSPGPTPNPIPPWEPMPPSAPADVSAAAGDDSAMIQWRAPASAGSFPITNYQAVLAPGGHACLVPVTTTTCTITGLSNGTTYTATVRALNAAGWSPYSTPSNTFTPQAPEPPDTPTIIIAGTRGDVRGKPGVVVTGTSTGLEQGARLKAWFRFPGQTAFTEGRATILVDQAGDFTWSRQTGKRITVIVKTADGSVSSNAVVVKAR